MRDPAYGGSFTGVKTQSVACRGIQSYFPASASLDGTVPMSVSKSHQPEPLAYCVTCLGVLPFDHSAGRLACRRCGTLYRRCDPGASMRRRSMRYFSYGLASGILPAGIIVAATALGPSHPLVTTREIVFGVLSGLMTVLCLAHAIRLRLSASTFESLNRAESKDLERWLCAGMVRSDIVDELSRHGWRIGKIRSVLSGLKPVSRDAV